MSRLQNTNLGRTVEKILGRVKKEKRERVSEEVPSGTITPPSSTPPSTSQKVYLKAFPLKSIQDVELIKKEVSSGNIVISRVGPLAKKSVDDVKLAVSELCEFAESIGGDIARLGEERIVITPSFVKIWREKAGTFETDSTVA